MSTYGPTVEQKAEALARKIAKRKGTPESMWEIHLVDAYMELFPVTKDDPTPEATDAR